MLFLVINLSAFSKLKRNRKKNVLAAFDLELVQAKLLNWTLWPSQ